MRVRRGGLGNILDTEPIDGRSTFILMEIPKPRLLVHVSVLALLPASLIFLAFKGSVVE